MMGVIKTLGVQYLIFLVDYPMFPKFLISGSIIFQVLGPMYVKIFRQLLTVLIGPIVKFVCDRRL